MERFHSEYPPAHVPQQAQALRGRPGAQQHLPVGCRGTRQNGTFRDNVSACGSPALPSCQALTCGGRGRQAQTAGQQREFQGPGLRPGSRQTTSSQRLLTPALNLSLDSKGRVGCLSAWHCADTARGPDAWQGRVLGPFRTLGRPALLPCSPPPCNLSVSMQAAPWRPAVYTDGGCSR